MVSQGEILEVFRRSTQESLMPGDVAAELKVKVSQIQVQLDRLDKDKHFLQKNEDGSYTITDDGKVKHDELTMDQAQLTPSQQFKNIGVQIGVKEEIAELITDHVFRIATDYRDMVQVWKALNEMSGGIKPDLLNMWFQGWRGICNVPVPSELEGKLTGGTETTEKKAADGKKIDEKEAAKGAGSNVRDYILDDHDSPQRVGEEYGAMTYEDAMSLSKARAIGISRGGGGNKTGDSQAIEIIKAVKELMPANGGIKGRTFVAHEDVNGQVAVEEVEDDGKPVVLPQGGGTPPAEKIIIHDDGTTEKVDPSTPIIIHIKEKASDTPPAQKTQYMVYDPTSRQMKPWDGVSPIDLGNGQGQPNGAGPLPTMLPATLGGKEVAISLDNYFKLQEHQQKMEQDDESHQVKMDIAKGARKLLNAGIRAFSSMSDEEEPEEDENK